MQSTLGFTAIAMAIESICCSPPERSPARVSIRAASGGKSSSARRRASATAPASRRTSQVASRRFSATVSVGKMPRPPGIIARPLAAIFSGASLSIVSPSKVAVPWRRRQQAAQRLEHRGLAGSVGAQQRDDLALADVEVDAEQHLVRAVGRLDPAAAQRHLTARQRGVRAGACVGVLRGRQLRGDFLLGHRERSRRGRVGLDAPLRWPPRPC